MQVYDRISDYLKLRNDITILRENELTSVKTLVDLGCNIYCQAQLYAKCASVNAFPVAILTKYAPHRPDVSRIFVDVGFGFHAELTLDEALAFIAKKTAHLEKYIPHFLPFLPLPFPHKHAHFSTSPFHFLFF